MVIVTIIFQIWVEYLARSGNEYKELKPQLRGNTKQKDNLYYSIQLSNNGKVKNYNVHRLVALHFIANPRMLKCVDHIDNDKYNNKASNLRWVTPKENMNNPNSNKIRPVARFTIDGKYIDERPSITAYADEFGFKQANISACCQGKLKLAYGYKWEYLTKDGYLPY